MELRDKLRNKGRMVPYDDDIICIEYKIYHMIVLGKNEEIDVIVEAINPKWSNWVVNLSNQALGAYLTP